VPTVKIVEVMTKIVVILMFIGIGCGTAKQAVKHSSPKLPDQTGVLSISQEEFEGLHGYFIDSHNFKTDSL